MIDRIGLKKPGDYRPAPPPVTERPPAAPQDSVSKSAGEKLTLIPRPKVPHGGMMPPSAPPPAPQPAPLQLESYQGNFNGKAFTVSKPAGWNVTPVPIGVVMSDPGDPKVSASFSWLNGMGPMNPQGLINGIASQMGLADIKVVAQKTENTFVPQAGQVPMLFEEVTFKDRDGKSMHALAVSQVGVIPGVFMPSWFGSLSVAAAPEEKWASVGEDLKKMLGSFALKA